MKSAISKDRKPVPEITKYVFTAGVLAGTFYGSLKSRFALGNRNPKPVETKPKARAAAA